MRLTSIQTRKIAGLERVEVSDLSDVVVFAGPNGVGKTRLLRSLIDFFRDPKSRNDLQVTLEATSELELKAWKKPSLDTKHGEDCTKLRAVLQRSQRRNRYRSTILNFDSDRAITQVRSFGFSWDIPDPFEEDVGWDLSYSYLRDRFQDVRDSLFKLVESQRRKIAETAIKLKAEGAVNMPLDFPDPLDEFKKAFHRLLAPKTLVDVNVKQQQIFYEFEGNRLQIETLSSGEREVVNIVFDFLLRNPSDCIVFFDEPELHLHPELSYKLLQTLASIGTGNQFIFCTHSPEIITASIENSVIFLTPKKPDGSNQALMVTREDATHHALNLLGQSIGIISLGKKLLLIEGEESSLDKQTYGAILQNEFPELILVPVGGKSTIQSFDNIRKSVLNRTIWGVEFFMLCDRDAVYDIGQSTIEANQSDRLKVLPRYHLENYFLDENVLAKIFSDMEPSESWLRDPDAIKEKLAGLAIQTIPLAVSLRTAAAIREIVGNIDIMAKGISPHTTPDELLKAIDQRVSAEKARIAQSLDFTKLEQLVRTDYERLDKLVKSGGSWKSEIPGRVIFNRFASEAKLQSGRLKALYLRNAKIIEPDPFKEIRDIFHTFRNAG